MGGQPPLLTKLELAVMRVLWEAEREPLTIRAIVDHLNEGRTKPFAYTTIQTMVMILKKKGVVKAASGSGKAHWYVARLSRDAATRSLVGDFLDRMFEGRIAPLLSHLIEQKSVPREELQDLRRLIDSHLADEEEPDR